MESTGVYWKPVYYVLEERAPAAGQRRARQQVPGRKTDVRDCEWLAQLLRARAAAGSFVPPAADSRVARSDALSGGAGPGSHPGSQPAAQGATDAGIQLAQRRLRRVGQSGRAMLAALVEGTTDPERLGRPGAGQAAA